MSSPSNDSFTSSFHIWLTIILFLSLALFIWQGLPDFYWIYVVKMGILTFSRSQRKWLPFFIIDYNASYRLIMYALYCGKYCLSMPKLLSSSFFFFFFLFFFLSWNILIKNLLRIISLKNVDYFFSVVQFGAYNYLSVSCDSFYCCGISCTFIFFWVFIFLVTLAKVRVLFCLSV
jgi:hypothetical protein